MTNSKNPKSLDSSHDIDDNFKLHQSLKSSSYNSSIKRIRRQLPNKHQRMFSSFIHAPGMDNFNNMLANTLARPKSIIAGSILAMIGVSGGVLLSKYYGYSYNYLLLFIFFIIGYLLELIIELVLKFFIRNN